MRRRVAMLLAVLLCVLAPPAGEPALAAAGPVSGLYIDGAADDPLSEGLQVLYEPPAATLTQVSNSSNRTTVALASSVGGWTFRFQARTGEELEPGPYQAFPDPTTVYGGLLVTRAGHTCDFWGASFTVLEIEWAPGDNLVRFAADFHHSCFPREAMFGSIRYNATTPIRALATDVLALDAGQTELGQPGSPVAVTVTNIGQTPVVLGTATAGSGDVEITGDTCDDAPLAGGHSCAVQVRLTGVAVGLNRLAMLDVPDDTPRGGRRIRVEGEVWTDTTTTLVFDPARAHWPNGTFVGATVTPPPAHGGSVTFSYPGDAGPVEFTTLVPDDGEVGMLVDVPRGDHVWTASFSGDNGWRASTSAPATAHTGLATSITLVAEVNPVSLGQAGQLRAEALGASGVDLPPGTISITRAGGAIVGSGTVGAGGSVIEVSVPGLGLGSHDFRATYVSTGDGATTTTEYRLFVQSQGIEEAWTGAVPMTSGVLQLAGVATDGAGIYVVGSTGGVAAGEASAGWVDVVVARMDSQTGAVTWATQFGTPLGDWGSDVAVTSQGVFVSGRSDGALEAGGGTGTDRPFVARLTPAGDVAWIRQGGRPGDAWMVAGAPDGGVYVAGTAESSSVPPRNAGQVRRYAPDGSLRWEREIAACCGSGGGPGDAWLASLASDPGGLLVAGFANGSTATSGSLGSDRGWVRRYTPAGVASWTREITASVGGVRAVDVAASEGGILVTGTSSHPIAGQPNQFPNGNAWMRRYSFTGSTVWTKPLTRDHLAPDCAGFVATAGSQPLLWASQGGTLARLTLDGLDGWRFERPGTETSLTGFTEAALAPGRAYVLMSTGTFDATDTRILALRGIPIGASCDTKPPTVTTPRASFVAGTVLGSTATVKVAWTGTDAASGVARHELRRRSDAGPWVVASDGLASPGMTQQLAPGHDYRFSARAVDRAGNATFAQGPEMTLRRLDDRSSTVRYGGTWRSTTASTASSGTLRYSGTAGATASVRFTGRAVAWVAPRGPTRGSARVYVDGTYVATVSLWRSTSDARRLVWSRHWATPGTHTVTVRVSGTAGHPRVDIDAFLVLD